MLTIRHTLFLLAYIFDIRDIPVNQTIENKPRLFYMQIKLINVRVIISEYSLLDWYINMFMTSSIDRTKNTHHVRRFFFLVVTLFLAEDESINTRLDTYFWVACSIYLYLANIYVIDLTFKVEGYTKVLFFMDRQSIIFWRMICIFCTKMKNIPAFEENKSP